MRLIAIKYFNCLTALIMCYANHISLRLIICCSNVIPMLFQCYSNVIPMLFQCPLQTHGSVSTLPHAIVMFMCGNVALCITVCVCVVYLCVCVRVFVCVCMCLLCVCVCVCGHHYILYVCVLFIWVMLLCSSGVSPISFSRLGVSP